MTRVGEGRDRHDRGLRGRLASPNPHTGKPVPIASRNSRQDFFIRCVSDALSQIANHCPQALTGIDVGIEDVPTLQPSWAPNQILLAAATSATPGRPAQVVVFRRPIERRAVSRNGLRILVFRTIVEQLSSLTGIPVEDIDPHGHREDYE